MRNNNFAFTVMELLTSVVIIAVLVTTLSVVFNISIQSYKQAEDIVNIANKAQRFMGQITTELSGAMVLRTPSTKAIPFVGANASVFFMAPANNTSGVELCEFGYAYSSSKRTIDRKFITFASTSGLFQYPNNVTVINDSTPQTLQRYIDNVQNLTFRYYDTIITSATLNQWIPTWANDAVITNRIYILPERVEITVSMTDARGQQYTFTTRVYIPGSTDNP